jgi:hypothetical protein
MSAIHAVNKGAETTLHSVTAAGTGYLFAKNLMTLNPVHAAAISAISVVVSKVTSPLFQMFFGGPEANGSSLLLGSVLNITASVSATIAAASALGYSISVPAWLYLSAVAIATYVLVNLGILAASAEVVSLEASFLR